MKGNRFEVFTSLLIAIVTICAALTAWRANVASIAADDADFEGLSSSIQAQEARIVNAVKAFEHYRAYTAYYRYNLLGDGLSPDGAGNSREKSEYWGIALGLQYLFFPSRYLDSDGHYDVQRELDELWAESKSQADLNPVIHFEEADLDRDKSYSLTGTLIVFAVAFFFLTLSQAFRSFLRYIFALGGTLTLFAGILLALIFEFQ